ncbi:conserved hypothetical protein [Burkholderiales bacterium]|nr:conserved hypothetical protein [Burkholderiales bacterium]
MKAIASDANPAFRRWLRIATTPRAARASGQTLAEGIHLAQAAIAATARVDAIVLRRGAAAPQLEALLEQFPPTVARYELAAALYERLAPVEQGAGLLLVLPIPDAPLPRHAGADLVYLDGVQDPGNVGAVIRTAAAAGVGHVLASAGTASLWAPKVLRAGMGAHFRIGLHERVSAAQLPAALDGNWVAAVAHDAPSLWEHAFSRGPMGWIFGAEGRGPSAEALAVCRQRLRIPTSNCVESLNVAAAAAVCLFERLRLR